MSRPIRIHATALVALLAAPASLTNPAPLTGQNVPPNRWDIFVDLGLDASGGNKDLIILRSAVGATFVGSDRVEFDLSGSYRYGEDDGEVIERQLRGAIKMDINPDGTWSPFVFGSGFRDPIRRRLDILGSLGVGAKHTYFENAATDASLSLAGLGTIEKFTAVEGLETPDDRHEVRVSWRSRFERDLTTGSSLEQNVSYQPVWDTWSDYTFVARTGVRSKLVGALSLVVTHEFIHDESPAEGVEKDDWTLNLGFRYEF